jgi:ribonuclease J
MPLIEQALLNAASEGGAEPHQLSQLVRRVVGKWVSDNFRRRPMIIPTIVEV